ncbi:MAG: flippase-like domain-containing protein [Deltaproteobacteria bacterium]|nr:flippase-like domain-containing protein [Deltaproteobacteria bacterium]
MKKIPKSIQLFIKGFISLAFFSVLLSFVQGNELAKVFAQVNWFYMAITFGVTLVMVLASCAKWKLILDLKEDISFFKLFKIYLVGYFFSNILPSTVGGDVVRSYYAGKLIENQSYSAVSVFVERFSGIVFLFLLVAVAPLFQSHLYTNPYIFVPACAGLCFALVTGWIWKAKNPFHIPNLIAEKIFLILQALAKRMNSQLLLKLTNSLENIYRKILGRLKKVREELGIAIAAIKTDKGFLYRLIFLTLFFYLLTWVNVYTSFMAFDVEVDFIKICAIVPAIMLVAHVPVTLLGNLGYFESVFVFYFLLVGVGGAESLAMGLLLRIKMLTMGIVGFATYLVYKQKNKLHLTGNKEK